MHIAGHRCDSVVVHQAFDVIFKDASTLVRVETPRCGQVPQYRWGIDVGGLNPRRQGRHTGSAMQVGQSCLDAEVSNEI